MEDSHLTTIVPIIVAIIGFFSALAGAVFGYLGRLRKQAVLEAKREQKEKDNWDRVFKDIESMKKRLDDHNHYAEKFAKNSEELAKVNVKLDQVCRDIDILKSNKFKL